MRPKIFRQFGMKRRHKHIILPRRNDFPVLFRKHVYVCSRFFDIRSADEYSRKKTDRFQLHVRAKRSELSSVSVSFHRNVHRTQIDVRIVRQFFGKKDQSRARTEDGKPPFNGLLYGI